MNPFRKKPKTHDPGTVSPSHIQPATSLSVRGPLKRARSWVGGLLHPKEQPLEPAALVLSTPASTSTLPTGPAVFVSNPTLSPPANLGIPSTSPSSVFGPPSTSTPAQDNPSPVSGPVLDPVPNDSVPEATPVVPKDPFKKSAWIAFRETLKILEKVAGAVPFVHFGDVIGGLNAVLDKLDEADGNREDIETITRHIKRIQTIVEPLKPGSMSDVPRVTDSLTTTIGNLERELTSLTSTAKNRKEQSKSKQVIGSSDNASIMEQMNQDFDRALQAFQTETILDMANRLETQAQDELIKHLPRADNAGWNSGLRSISGVTTCLENTQEATLGLIEAWSDDVDAESPPIFWVWGMAGTGKTTISQTVAQREDQTRKRLGASFFFSRDTKEQSNPLLLIPTLAYQLSRFNSVYKAHLAKALKAKPDVGCNAIEEQLTALLVDPLSACKSLPSPIIIVIDALDECEPESVWKTIIRALGDHIPKIRQKVKILATSRPEDKLHSEFRSSTLDTYSKSWKLHEIDEEIVSGDIERYIDYHLQRIASDHKLPETWPEKAQRDILVKKAGTLFIVAATLIKFIDDDTSGPMAELNALTKDDVTGALGHGDALIVMYTTIINLALRSKTSSGNSDKAFRISELIHTVVGTIILVKDPMTRDTLTVFLQGLNVSGALSHLHSLLIVPATSDAPIRVLHQSFPEYLTNPQQSDSRLYIDPAVGHARLATLCLTHLHSLKRSPSKIVDLTRLNIDIDDTRGRVDGYIAPHIRYSSLHFSDHIASSSQFNNRSLASTLAAFCESGLLAWIEVLSGLGRLDIAIDALKGLREWYTVRWGACFRREHTITTKDSWLQVTSGSNPSDLVMKALGHAQHLLGRVFDVTRGTGSQVEAIPGLSLSAHPLPDTVLSTLAVCLHVLYYRTGQLGHLDEAINLNRQVVQLRPVPHTKRYEVLSHLAECLQSRFRVIRDEKHLQEAIRLNRDTLELLPLEHADHHITLNNLAACLVDRFQLRRNTTDIAEATAIHQTMSRCRSPGHTDRGVALNNIAARALNRDDLKNSTADLDERVRIYRVMLKLGLPPAGQLNRNTVLIRLVGVLLAVYKRTDEIHGLAEAISLLRQAQELGSPGHPKRHDMLTYLKLSSPPLPESRRRGGSRGSDLPRSKGLGPLSARAPSRYRWTKSVVDLSESIELHRAILVQYHDQPENPFFALDMLSLAACLHNRCNSTHDVRDLDEGIDWLQKCLQLCSPEHQLHGHALVDMAACLQSRFDRTGDTVDIVNAIRISDRAPEHRPRGYPLCLDILVRLAQSLSSQLSHHESRPYSAAPVRRIISLVREATRPSPAPVQGRLWAANTWRSLAREHDDLSELEATKETLNLLDLAVAESASVETLHSRLYEDLSFKHVHGVGSDAAAIAIELGDHTLAVSLLEQGRSAIFAGLGHFRSSIEDVREVSLDLAIRFVELSAELDDLVVDSGGQEDTFTADLQVTAAHYSHTRAQRNTTVEDIRRLPGLESFLLPPPFHRLQQAAEHGPVVIVNINERRSDAIIVISSGDPVCVQLPDAHPEVLQCLVECLREGQAAYNSRAAIGVLAEIWSIIVSPIVDQLRDSPVQLAPGSRIWWCPVGAASMLPLHAAGPYKRGEPNLAHIFVSSYTPTLGALIRARQSRVAGPATQTPVRSVLVVGQVGRRPLPNATNEIKAIENLVPSASILQSSEATKEAVLQGIQECKWLHLACHNCYHPTQPFKSHFSTHDGPISLLDLISKDLPQAELAVLSACRSARISEVLPDESLHLAAGMFFAGFKSVIGTMWAFDDGLGGPLAEEFYRIILEGGTGYTDAAAALSDAFREVMKRDKMENSLMQFINAVHYGV